jgi:hypothetical protein
MQKLYQQLFLLIIVSTLCIVTLPLVSAADASSSSSRTSIASQDQVDTINALWGSDITIGEYMEKVHPEHLAGVPNEVKKDMYTRKMIWPDEKPVDSANGDSRVSTLASLNVIGDLSIYSNHVNFWSTATLSSGTASYIYVESFLKNAADTTVGSTSGSNRGTNSVACSNNVMWPAAGYYHVHSWGYTITPSSEGSHHSSAYYFAG